MRIAPSESIADIGPQVTSAEDEVPSSRVEGYIERWIATANDSCDEIRALGQRGEVERPMIELSVTRARVELVGCGANGSCREQRTILRNL